MREPYQSLWDLVILTLLAVLWSVGWLIAWPGNQMMGLAVRKTLSRIPGMER